MRAHRIFPGPPRKLDAQSLRLERLIKGLAVEEVIAQERARSPDFGGHSVFGWERPSPSAVERGVARTRRS